MTSEFSVLVLANLLKEDYDCCLGALQVINLIYYINKLDLAFVWKENFLILWIFAQDQLPFLWLSH